MSENYFDLPARIMKSFPDIDSDIVMDLRKTNKEYAELFQQASEIKQKNLFIDMVLEGSGGFKLTAEEHVELVSYLRLSRKMDDMERLHIYYRGHTDAFAYLKQIKAI